MESEENETLFLWLEESEVISFHKFSIFLINPHFLVRFQQTFFVRVRLFSFFLFQEELEIRHCSFVLLAQDILGGASG